LFDRIENLLPFVSSPNFVKESFGGIYSHQIISKECQHSSEREEQFLSISLEVKKNIQEGFLSLVKGETLEGENKYYCERCDKKVKAEKRLTLKRLPESLILCLKRFEFNYEIDAKTKIN
jgi:ubiquitin carboxyl-terminal hydrolase 9/24